MADFEDRMKGVERATGGGRPVFVHAAPGWTREQAIAYHHRTQGPIPLDAKLIVIRHSFLSPLSFWPDGGIGVEAVSDPRATSSTSRG